MRYDDPKYVSYKWKWKFHNGLIYIARHVLFKPVTNVFFQVPCAQNRVQIMGFRGEIQDFASLRVMGFQGEIQDFVSLQTFCVQRPSCYLSKLSLINHIYTHFGVKNLNIIESFSWTNFTRVPDSGWSLHALIHKDTHLVGTQQKETQITISHMYKCNF